MTPKYLDACAFVGVRLDNVCKAKLDTVVMYAKRDLSGYILLQGDALTSVARSTAMKTYIENNGVQRVLVQLSDTRSNEVSITFVQ